jgi:hypothetical protein
MGSLAAVRPAPGQDTHGDADQPGRHTRPPRAAGNQVPDGAEHPDDREHADKPDGSL